MSNWRDRLCGTELLHSASDDAEAPSSIQQLLDSNNQILSCGGGFFPVNINNANMTTFKDNFVLPTQKYSVLIFNKEGHAVIYSEEDEVIANAMEKQSES